MYPVPNGGRCGSRIRIRITTTNEDPHHLTTRASCWICDLPSAGCCYHSWGSLSLWLTVSGLLLPFLRLSESLSTLSSDSVRLDNKKTKWINTGNYSQAVAYPDPRFQWDADPASTLHIKCPTSSVSDPDSGVFWIRIRGLTKNLKC